MPVKPVGYQWLKEKYNLSRHALTHSSYIGSNESIELTSKGNVEQTYGPRYAPSADTDFLHLEFSLKYDDISLDFLSKVFEKVDPFTSITHARSGFNIDNSRAGPGWRSYRSFPRCG